MSARLATVLTLILLILTHVPARGAENRRFGENADCIDVELHKSFLLRSEHDVMRLSIADAKVADAVSITPRQILIVAGERPGTTQLIVWHEDDEAEVFEVRVFVPGDLRADIESRIRQIVPLSRVRVWSVRDGVLLDGEVASQDDLQRVLAVVRSFGMNAINLVAVRGSQQVQIEVRIAEVSRSGMKQMGLGAVNTSNWGIGLLPAGTTVTGSGTAASTSGVAATMQGTALDAAMELSSPFSNAFQAAAMSVSGDTLAILSILKEQGLARLLARPTLVTMSGQEADFLVGGEFPIPTQSGDGATSVEFRQFGVMLRFTPTVVGTETITLKVAPEVSTPDYALAVYSGGVAVPGLKTRRGTTTLQLKDNQTFVMAGLLTEETSTSVQRIPFLGDLPILGALFSSKQFQKNESELVIVVTPHLVRALNPEEVPPLPGETMRDQPNDLEFYLNFPSGRDGAAGGSASAASGAVFIGEHGFAR